MNFSNIYNITNPCRTALTVDVRNDSGTPITAYTAVTFTGSAASQEAFANQLPGFEIKTADDPALPWGIAATAIAPGAWGTAVISGAVPAYFARNPDGSCWHIPAGYRAVPSPAGLLPRGDYGAAVLCPARQTNGTDCPGIIMLDSRGTVCPGGNFSVKRIAVTENRFSITGGSTDFYGLENIPDAEVTFSRDYGTVYLVIKYTRDSNGTPVYSYEYQLGASVSAENGDFFAFKLADVDVYGAVTGLWTQGRVSMPGWLL